MTPAERLPLKQLHEATTAVVQRLSNLRIELDGEMIFESRSVLNILGIIDKTFSTFKAQLDLIAGVLPHNSSQFVARLDGAFRDLIVETHHDARRATLDEMPEEEIRQWFMATSDLLHHTSRQCLAILEELKVLLANSSEPEFPSEVSPPAIAVVWNPELVSAEDYAKLMNAIGDLVRCNDGLGIKLLHTETKGVECVQEVLL